MDTWGGDGADLDVITAASSDARKGKVIVDKDGNPLTGIMAEIAAKTYTPGTSNRLLRLISSWPEHRLLRGRESKCK